MIRHDAETCVARIGEQLLCELPRDLYIPPHALAVVLDAFEGPLDLLLYLIRKQNIDILDIPIAEVTRQYMAYIELMQDVRLELAADYLVMAAWLARIKSRMLLPCPPQTEDEEEDPRLALVRRLQDYELLRQMAERLDALPRLGRDVFPLSVQPPMSGQRMQPPKVGLDELVEALRAALQRAALIEHHHIQRDAISVRERMSLILRRLGEAGDVQFLHLLIPQEGRRGVVISFLAVLELLKLGQIAIENDPEGLFLLRAKSQ